jgi:hypothetical protein
VPAAVSCAPAKSTFNPEIKIKTVRMAMVRDLCRVFIIIGPWGGEKLLSNRLI